MIDWVLIDKSLHGELSSQEQKNLDRWLGESPSHRRLYARISAGEDLSLDEEGLRRALADFEEGMRRSRRRRRMRWSYAAAALIPFAAAVYLLVPRTAPPADQPAIVPGHTVATITLPSGRVVEMANPGAQIVESGDTLAVVDGGDVIYESLSGGDGINATLNVPRGGEFDLTLPDGTRVWLNSDSHLTYPAAFGQGPRRVELRGEAYFSVSPDPERPFTVVTGGYDIVVTGTQFNVRCFEAGQTVTTLVEGGVEIRYDGAVTRLRPGQQSMLADGRIDVREVQTEDYTAWREGYFNFPQQPLDGILQELARWYDIDVEYENPEAGQMRFVARFSRYAPIEQVMDILMRTRRVTLTLDGRCLTVS